jgi:uncharacterized membrane protein
MNEGNFFTRWRTNFFTGLAIVLPAIISVAVLIWLFGTISGITDTLLFFLPKHWTHQHGAAGPGTGPVYWYWSLAALILAVFLITAIGRFARNYFAERVLESIDGFLLRIPLLNKIYGTVKQVNEAFTSNKSSFKGVVLVPYPHANSYSIGFVTSDRTLPKTGEKLIGVFIPTTPNPTAGFLIFVPEPDVMKMDMSVAEGIKFIISLGAIPPEQQRAEMAKLKPHAD